MNRFRRFRLLALALAAILGLPSPASALRPKSVRESPASLQQVRSGLEERQPGGFHRRGFFRLSAVLLGGAVGGMLGWGSARRGGIHDPVELVQAGIQLKTPQWSGPLRPGGSWGPNYASFVIPPLPPGSQSFKILIPVELDEKGVDEEGGHQTYRVPLGSAVTPEMRVLNTRSHDLFSAGLGSAVPDASTEMNVRSVRVAVVTEPPAAEEPLGVGSVDFSGGAGGKDLQILLSSSYDQEPRRITGLALEIVPADRTKSAYLSIVRPFLQRTPERLREQKAAQGRETYAAAAGALLGAGATAVATVPLRRKRAEPASAPAAAAGSAAPAEQEEKRKPGRDLDWKLARAMGEIYEQARLPTPSFNAPAAAEGLDVLMQALLDRSDPRGHAGQVRQILERVEREILAPALSAGDEVRAGMSSFGQKLARRAEALPRADHWLAYQLMPDAASEEIFQARVMSLSVYSPRGSALLFGMIGPHLRREFLSTGTDKEDLRAMPVLLGGFLPRLRELLEQVEPDLRQGRSSPLAGEAREYAAALWNGLLFPGDIRPFRVSGTTLPDYRGYFAEWSGRLRERGIDLEELLGRTLDLFPEAARRSDGQIPEHLRFRRRSYGDDDVAAVEGFNVDRPAGERVSMWDVVTGAPSADGYLALARAKLGEKDYPGLNEEKWKRFREKVPQVEAELPVIHRFLIERAEAGLARRGAAPRPAPGPQAGLEEFERGRRLNRQLDGVAAVVKAARAGRPAAERERVGVVLDAEAVGDSSLLPALVRRLARDAGLGEEIAVWGEEEEQERWGPVSILRSPDDLGEWLSREAVGGEMSGVLFLGAQGMALVEGSKARLTERLARGRGMGFRAQPLELVKLLAAFVPEPLAKELAGELEAAAGLGRQL